jgi:biotin carboxyl carrier protein
LLGYRTLAAGQPAEVADETTQAHRSGEQRPADPEEEQARREAERLGLQQQLLEVKERLDDLDRRRKELLVKCEELKARLARPAPKAEQKQEARGDVIEVPSRQDGVLSTSGPRLKKGDHVKVGQVLARLDDRLAREDVEIKKAKLEQSEADLHASEKTRAEAQVRLERRVRLAQQAPAAVPQEDVTGSRLTVERYQAEVISKRAAVAVARAELHQAQTVAETYVVVSPINGVIRSTFRRPGEFVKQGQTLFVVQEDR